MKILKNIRDILVFTLITLISFILIDSLLYKGIYSYLYMWLAIVVLTTVLVMSVIIYDSSGDIKEENLTLLDRLKDGGSFKYTVCHIDSNPTDREKSFIKYMRILNGLDGGND